MPEHLTSTTNSHPQTYPHPHTQLAHKRQAAASVWVQEVGAQVAERARAAREARAGREAEEQAAAREAERQLAGQVLEARLRTRALADEQRAELQQQVGRGGGGDHMCGCRG